MNSNICEIINIVINKIKQDKGIDIIVDKIPLDDNKTFKLFQNANTNQTEMFESKYLKDYLRQLKPDKFIELIALNALYRPRLLDFIPHYINRKNGKEKIKYDLVEMEEYLSETYGITIYQEQIILLSRKLANFNTQSSDLLSKTLGKNPTEGFSQIKDNFISGCKSNNHSEKVCEKIWKDWEAIVQSTVKKSIYTNRTLLAYAITYLKANYPVEFKLATQTIITKH